MFILIQLKWDVKLIKNEHFRHFILFTCDQGSKATKAANVYSGYFYKRSIENLAERWEEVVGNNGECFTD